MKVWSLVLLCGLLAAFTVFAEEKLILDIEKAEDWAPWYVEVKQCEPSITSEPALRGSASLKVQPGAYMLLWPCAQLTGDWSGFDALQIDFDNQTGEPQPLSILVGDQDWKDAGNGYWDRHNSGHTLPVGRYTFSLPLEGLYRGEAGSRFNNLKNAINPAKIIRFDMGIGKAGTGGAIVVDNWRLVSTKLPDYIKAFDFGPEQQNVQMGFTPVTWNTAYAADKGYGLQRNSASANRARDDTFPPGPLYRDWLLMAESWEAREFTVDLPNGTYEVFSCFSDPGYWGGEAIRHTKRHIEAEGSVAWSEDLGAHGNYWKPNYLFENTEPLIGQDLWDLYMAKIFEPVRFTVQVEDGQLNLKWVVDNEFSCKVNSVIIYPAAKKAEGDAFVDSIVAGERQAFTVAAAEHRPPVGGSLDTIPQTEKSKGYIFFLTDYENDTYMTTIPAPDQIRREAEMSACLGEYEPLSFAIRPLKDLGDATVTVSAFTGAAGTLPAETFDIRVVRHLTNRSFNAINYQIVPTLLRRCGKVALPAEMTREFVVWAHIPDYATPGTYTGTVHLQSTGGVDETVKVSLTVHPFTLDNSDYVFGFFGTLRTVDDARLLRQLGFNSFSGGYQMNLKGFAKDGTPDIDFTQMDKYIAMLKEAGYTQEGWGYGGFSVSHIGYTKDENFFGKWEQETGLAYTALLAKVFDAVKAHSEANNWIPGVYSLIDETRNIEEAKKQVAQINAINQASSWIKTGGCYSVTFKDGRKKDDYHQWIFDALEASSLNGHDESVMAEAQKLGKEIYIYNQGLSRYSFGAYQWSEYQKGVKGRHQWHLHAEHGYQFFDLDGREPDTGVIYYGEKEPIPTLALIRSAEGADDFYYCQTLANRIAKMRSKGGESAAAAEKAASILTDIESKIKICERSKPDWLDNKTLRAACAAAIEELDRKAVGTADFNKAASAEHPAGGEHPAAGAEGTKTAGAKDASEGSVKSAKEATSAAKKKGCTIDTQAGPGLFFALFAASLLFIGIRRIR